MLSSIFFPTDGTCPFSMPLAPLSLFLTRRTRSVVFRQRKCLYVSMSSYTYMYVYCTKYCSVWSTHLHVKCIHARPILTFSTRSSSFGHLRILLPQRNDRHTLHWTQTLRHLKQKEKGQKTSPARARSVSISIGMILLGSLRRLPSLSYLVLTSSSAFVI